MIHAFVYRAIVAAAAALGVASSGCTHEPTPAEQQFLEDLGSTSITIYPTYVRVHDSGRYDAASADQIAAFLRDERLAEVTRSGEQPPMAKDWQMNQSAMYRESREALAQWVKEHPIATKYAAMAEFLKGSEDRVAGGIHLYVISADGQTAFGVGLNSHHKLFQDAQPVTVEQCTDVVIRSMKEQIAQAKEKRK